MRRIKLALYDPLNPDAPIHRTSELMLDTPRNREIATGAIEDFNRMAGGDDGILLNLGIFPARRKPRRKSAEGGEA
jgi:hypothetical protein